VIVYLIVAITLIVAGAVGGGLVVVVAGIRREERSYRYESGCSFTAGSPGRSASAARAISGAYARRP
jgi:hypothetical protein